MNATLPPHLPVDQVLTFLRDTYGLDGKLAPLDGERDQNFWLAATTKHVVKVCNRSEGPALVAAQVDALRHIAAVDPALPVPRVIAPRNPSPLVFEGEDYPVMVLSWLDGEVMGERDFPADHYRRLGKVLGRLTTALRGFASAAITARTLAWNTARFSLRDEDLALLPPAARPLVSEVAADAAARVQPALAHLPAQVIHGDIHPFNTLINEAGEIAGLIDFGDLIHAPRLLDLSNALADCLLPGQDSEKLLRQMIAGYVLEVPLEEAEVDLILPLMRARLAITALVTARRRADGAAVTPQIAALDSVSLDILKTLAGDALLPAIRHAANFTPRRTAARGDILTRRHAAMGPKPLLFYDKPLHMVRGEGVWLEDADGRHHLDCYNNVAHVGHANPQVAAAVARQLRLLNTNTRYLTDAAIEYAERLKATLDPSLDTVVFVNSGSEANDVAARIAQSWTGKSGLLIMDHAYHGVTETSDAMSPSNYPPGKFHKPHVQQLEAPDIYRGPHRPPANDLAQRYAADADRAISSLVASGHGIALAIIDSAFMTNGIINAPPGYVAEIALRTRAAGGLFVADEVQSGFGRMGSHMWGHQHHGVVPDIVTIGKPAGNGYPLGAIITRADILARFVAETGPFFSTFGGGNAACAAGVAVLDVMEQDMLMANAAAVGEHFRRGLRSLMVRHSLIGDVRGAGLAIGVELVRDRVTLEPASSETRQVINTLRHEGVLVGSDGKLGNVLKMRPPLVFTAANADLVVTTLYRVLARLF